MANDAWLRECYRKLRGAGAVEVRTTGGHTIFRLGTETLVLPNLGRRSYVNKNIIRQVDRAIEKAQGGSP